MELVIVVTIIIALAGVVLPRVTAVQERARVARAASDLKGMKRAVELLALDLGVYPTTTNAGGDPGLLSNDRVPASIIAAWRGPYLDHLPDVNAWGGEYDYGYGEVPEFDFDGNLGNESLVNLTGLSLSLIHI